LRPANTDKELTIQVYVTVALKWLIRGLHDFERRFPDVKVRLSTSYFDWNFDERNVDVGIILARTKLPGHYYRPLFKSYLVPVCSPKMKLTKPKTSPKQTHRRLYGRGRLADWLEGAGVTGVKPANRLTVDSYILAQEAAIEGRGCRQ